MRAARAPASCVNAAALWGRLAGASDRTGPSRDHTLCTQIVITGPAKCPKGKAKPVIAAVSLDDGNVLMAFVASGWAKLR